MKLSKNHWVVRGYMYLYKLDYFEELPTSFCKFFRDIIWAIVFFPIYLPSFVFYKQRFEFIPRLLIGIFVYLGYLFLMACGTLWIDPKDTLSTFTTFVVVPFVYGTLTLGILIGTALLGAWIMHNFIEDKWRMPRTPSFFKSMGSGIKDMTKKICPRITWID